jgi:hypothetical protein
MITGSRACLRVSPRRPPRSPAPAPEAASTRIHRLNDAALEEPPLNISERARLRELERENRELRMKTEFLGEAAAFFAQEYR